VVLYGVSGKITFQANTYAHKMSGTTYYGCWEFIEDGKIHMSETRDQDETYPKTWNEFILEIDIGKNWNLNSEMAGTLYFISYDPDKDQKVQRNEKKIGAFTLTNPVKVEK
jgi:hypothetical protein